MAERLTVQLRSRDLVRLRATVTRAASGPWPLETRGQQYHRCHVDQGRIHYGRANHVVPPFDAAVSPVEGLQPRMCRDYRARVRLFYAAAPLPVGGVWQIASDDDGRSFLEPTSVLPGGAFPSCCCDARTQSIFAVMYGGGNLYGWRERPNEVPVPQILVDQNGFPLVVEEDVAHVWPSPGGEARWLLVCRILDEGAISLWESWNDGGNWLRIATVLPGYLHPHVLTDPRFPGLVHVSGYKDGAYAGVLRRPAETVFGASVPFVDASGAPLTPADTTFGIASAFEPAGRWVLATRILGEPFISEWWSASFGRSWTRVGA